MNRGIIYMEARLPMVSKGVRLSTIRALADGEQQAESIKMFCQQVTLVFLRQLLYNGNKSPWMEHIDICAVLNEQRSKSFTVSMEDLICYTAMVQSSCAECAKELLS